MALSSLLQWKYGMEKINVTNLGDLKKLKPGYLISRKAMHSLPQIVRSVMAPLHFGCIVGINLEAIEKSTNVQEAMALAFRVMHYVKDNREGYCQVRETNMMSFIFGNHHFLGKEKKQYYDYEVNSIYVIPVKDEDIRLDIIEEAKKTKRQKSYNFWTRNCEHWAQKVLYGEEWSQTHSLQVQITCTLLVICCFVFLYFALSGSQKRNKPKTKTNEILV